MTKRAYLAGEYVESLAELVYMIGNNQPIYCRGKFYAVGWYQNWSFAIARQQIKFGCIRRAVKINTGEPTRPRTLKKLAKEVTQ